MDTTLKEIVHRLMAKTNEGKVNWLKGGSPNEFKLIMKDATFTISLFTNPMGQIFTECKIVNSGGDIVFREVASTSSTDGIFLKSAFDAIRDYYTGKKSVVSSILFQLDSDDIIGEKDTSDLPF